MGRSFKAGAVYFLLLYVIGFLLGATRELLLAPRLGVAVASAIEALPMLAAIIHFAPLIARRFGIPPKSGPRIIMGLAGQLQAAHCVNVTYSEVGVALTTPPPIVHGSRTLSGCATPTWAMIVAASIPPIPRSTAAATSGSRPVRSGSATV